MRADDPNRAMLRLVAEHLGSLREVKSQCLPLVLLHSSAKSRPGWARVRRGTASTRSVMG
jgi:hypothetical protein